MKSPLHSISGGFCNRVSYLIEPLTLHHLENGLNPVMFKLVIFQDARNYRQFGFRDRETASRPNPTPGRRYRWSVFCHREHWGLVTGCQAQEWLVEHYSFRGHSIGCYWQVGLIVLLFRNYSLYLSDQDFFGDFTPDYEICNNIIKGRP